MNFFFLRILSLIVVITGVVSIELSKASLKLIREAEISFNQYNANAETLIAAADADIFELTTELILLGSCKSLEKSVNDILVNLKNTLFGTIVVPGAKVTLNLLLEYAEKTKLSDAEAQVIAKHISSSILEAWFETLVKIGQTLNVAILEIVASKYNDVLGATILLQKAKLQNTITWLEFSKISKAIIMTNTDEVIKKYNC